MNALGKHMPSAADGEVEGIHQARVASRRLREVLPLVTAASSEHPARALRRDIRAITRRLGPLRELDVVLEMLTELDGSAPAHAAAVASVRTRTSLDRERMWLQVGPALARIQVVHLVRRIRDVADTLDTPPEIARCAARAAGRLDTRIARLDEAVGAAGVVYAAGLLHEVRIALKKFRYALEIAAELGRFRLDGSLKRLKSLQDLLGTMHDLQVLTGRVRDCEAVGRAAGARRALRALADELDERVRQLHSRYLDQRVTLVPVIVRARRCAATLVLMSGE